MTAPTKPPAQRKRATVPAKRLSIVDPRIEARRVEVRDAAAKRQRRTIMALGLVTLAAVGSMVFVQSSWLDVDRITISGAVHSDVFAVQDATEIELGDPLLELDLQAAAEAVRQQPWVQGAWVERKLNGDLTIHVEERVETAAVPTDAGFVLIDSSGRQLEIVAQVPSSFVLIEGIEASGVVGTPAPPAAQAAMRLSTALSPSLADRISRIYFEDTDLYVALHDGGRVLLGNDSGLTDKLVSLETMLDRVDLRCLWEIDLRVPSAPALTRVGADGVTGASLTNLAECS